MLRQVTSKLPCDNTSIHGSRKEHYTAALICVLSFCETPRAQAATLRPSILTGLMQQPSSQYYSYVQGGQVDVSKPDDLGLVRLQYLERPAFKSKGFIDQDFAAVILFGNSVIKHGDAGITALIGAGETWGYIRSEETGESGRYKIPGIATSFEGRWSKKYIDLRLSYQSLICQNSKDQLKAYVAWPFSFVLLSVAAPIYF